MPIYTLSCITSQSIPLRCEVDRVKGRIEKDIISFIVEN